MIAALAVVAGCALVALLLGELVEWSQARRARRNAKRLDEALRRHLP